MDAHGAASGAITAQAVADGDTRDDPRRPPTSSKRRKPNVGECLDNLPVLSCAGCPTAQRTFSISAGTTTPVSRLRRLTVRLARHGSPRRRGTGGETLAGARCFGEAGQVEARLRRFDGEYRWFLCRAEPVRDEMGTSSSGTAPTPDIEDRKGAEDKLRRSEQELRRMIDAHSPDHRGAGP